VVVFRCYPAWPPVYAVTIMGSAVSEWSYLVLGSAAEVVLVAVVYHACTSPDSSGWV
jgi:hypothetical protein